MKPVAPRLPPLARAALLLDLDGTLLDIAPAPDLVTVPPDLPDILLRLRAALGGALAIVTGRPVAHVDALLPGIAHAVAGEHGGALRLAPGAALERADLPAAPAAWLARTERLAAAHPGSFVERKARGFVVHYRAVPASGEALGAALGALVGRDPRFVLAPAHMAWEVRPRGADKGSAVRTLMAHPPFAGRLAVFIGDDVTDRDGIEAAEAAGGIGLFVPDVFGDAAGVRAWLAALAAGAAD